MTIPPDTPNPFVPGRGTTPEVFPGRETEKRIFRQQIHRLKANAPIPADIIISAPRGNGKTALINWLKKEIKTNHPENIDAIQIPVDDIKDLNGLANSLVPASRFKNLASKFKAIAASIQSLSIRTEWDLSNRTEHFINMITTRCQNKPLIMIVDEAHTLNPKIGKELLNASQIISNQAPFLIVLAGTPDLEPHLNTMSATFWTRNTHLKPGLLSIEDTRIAIEDPLRKHQISIDRHTLDEVVRDSQGYPFFIQVWGDELFDELMIQGKNHVDTAIQNAASERVNQRKDDHYKTYSARLRKQHLIAYALHIGKQLDTAEARCSDQNMEKLIEQTPLARGQTALDIQEQLRDTGYIWQGHPTARSDWILAIPSLTNHLEREYGQQNA